VNGPRTLALCAALALGVLAPACGKFDPVVPTVPEVSGPAPALDGTWDFTMERGALPPCPGVMTIDGAIGSGTFTACGSQAGTVAGTVDDAGGVLIVFTPAGLEPFWTRGRLYAPGDYSGSIHGPGWNGQQTLRAVRR
jgi:hypothetical protein